MDLGTADDVQFFESPAEYEEYAQRRDPTPAEVPAEVPAEAPAPDPMAGALAAQASPRVRAGKRAIGLNAWSELEALVNALDEGVWRTIRGQHVLIKDGVIQSGHLKGTVLEHHELSRSEYRAKKAKDPSMPTWIRHVKESAAAEKDVPQHVRDEYKEREGKDLPGSTAPKAAEPKAAEPKEQSALPPASDDPAPGKDYFYHGTPEKFVSSIGVGGLRPQNGPPPELSFSPHLDSVHFWTPAATVDEPAVLLRMKRKHVRTVRDTNYDDFDNETAEVQSWEGVAPQHIEAYRGGKWVPLKSLVGNADEGVWRTIRGQHVLIKDGVIQSGHLKGTVLEPHELLRGAAKAKRGELVPTQMFAGKRTLAGGKAMPKHIPKVPPSYSDVRVSLDPKAEVLATARDGKGNIHTYYSSAHEMAAAARKFARTTECMAKMDEMTVEMARSPQREEADCLWLIRSQGTRPGSDKELGARTKAYGATTLEGRHVVPVGARGARLRFVGKEGVVHDHLVSDTRLAAMLRDRAKAAGKGGRLFATTAEKLNRFSERLDGGLFTPKDFRTALATRLAVEEANRVPTPRSVKGYKAGVKRVAERVSSVLGNRPEQALKSYIAPEVFHQWKAAAGPTVNAEDEGVWRTIRGHHVLIRDGAIQSGPHKGSALEPHEMSRTQYTNVTGKDDWRVKVLMAFATGKEIPQHVHEDFERKYRTTMLAEVKRAVKEATEPKEEKEDREERPRPSPGEYYISVRRIYLRMKNKDGEEKLMPVTLRSMTFADPWPVGSSGQYRVNLRKGKFTVSELPRVEQPWWTNPTGARKPWYTVGDKYKRVRNPRGRSEPWMDQGQFRGWLVPRLGHKADEAIRRLASDPPGG